MKAFHLQLWLHLADSMVGMRRDEIFVVSGISACLMMSVQGRQKDRCFGSNITSKTLPSTGYGHPICPMDAGVGYSSMYPESIYHIMEELVMFFG